MSETLGQRIAQRRRMLSLSQESFGEKMGVSRQAISKWESDAATPEVDRLIDMSKLFDVSVGWLLGTEPDQNDTDSEAAEIPLVFLPPEPVSPPPERTSPMEPEPEHPRNPFVWLLPICTIMMAISLVLSISAFYRSGQQTASSAASSQSNEELLNQISVLQESVTYWEKRSEHIFQIFMENKAQIDTNATDLKNLENYVYSLPTASGLVCGQTKYEQFQSWNLTGSMFSHDSMVTMVFSCTLNNNINNIFNIDLNVFLNDTPVSVQKSYTISGATHTIAFELEPANGYRYEVEIHYSNGTSERFELTGHNMSNLIDKTMPEIQVTHTDRISPAQITNILATYENITLSRPILIPVNYGWDWMDLKLIHYKNGEPVLEYDLSPLMNQLYHKGDSFSFSLDGKKFPVQNSVEGDVHEIRLEGTSQIRSISNLQPLNHSFSILLEQWKHADGMLHLIEQP